MVEQNSSAVAPIEAMRGSVRVTLAGARPSRWRTAGRYGILAAVVVATSATVLFGYRFVLAATASDTQPGPPAALLVANPASRTVPGSARLAVSEPRVLLDTRGPGRLDAGGEVAVPLAGVPRDSTAVLLEVSVLDATGPGAVTLTSAAGPVVALRVPKPKAQLTATVVVPIGPDQALTVATEGGGQLTVNLVGAFEPAESATAGRIVAIASTPVLQLVPDTDGHDADLDPYQVPAIRAAGSVSAVLLQVSADVGPNGGMVSTGPSTDLQTQAAYWSATSGTDRTRTALLVIPVGSQGFHLHYKAGSILNAAIVGYVTGAGAAPDTAGLAVPVPAGSVAPVVVPAGSGTTVVVVPAKGLARVPVDRVSAGILAVTATGDATGGVVVRAPGPDASSPLTLVADQGSSRSATVLVPIVNGAVQVDSQAGASVTVRPQALILT